MPKKLPRPAVKVGDIVEARSGKRRRYWGRAKYHPESRGPEVVAWEAIRPRKRNPSGWLPPATADALGIPSDVRHLCCVMEDASWNRWIAGGRIVEEGAP